jgi:hypothetical protein
MMQVIFWKMKRMNLTLERLAYLVAPVVELQPCAFVIEGITTTIKTSNCDTSWRDKDKRTACQLIEWSLRQSA